MKATAALTLSLWIGGLTFYALVVVPIGTDIIGGTTQGFITQRVTTWLNWIGLVAIIVLLPGLRYRWMRGTWGLLAVTLATLFALHPQLDALLVNGEVIDHGTFYIWHRAYLIVTAVQWLAGVIHLWALVHSTATTSPDSLTSTS